MSYRLRIAPRQRKAGRFIGQVRDAFLRAISDDKSSGGRITQQSIAQKLGVDRSVVNRWLTGEANLTLRSIADLAWALNRDLIFELRRPVERDGSNVVTLSIVSESAGPKLRKTRVEKQTFDATEDVL